MRARGLHLGSLDGQRGGHVAAPGVDGDQQPGLDPGHQGADVELHGQAELDRAHLAPVHQYGDGRLLGHGDLVTDQVHQLRAARRSQRAPGGAHQIVVPAPPSQQQAVQADVQQPGGRPGGLARCGLPGGLRQSLQGPVQVSLSSQDPFGQDLPGQGLGRIRGRAEQQGSGGPRLDGRCHGRRSSIVVTMALTRGSIRTISAG
jgi:hypothetical protein